MKTANVQIEPPPRLFAEVGSNAGLAGTAIKEMPNANDDAC